MGTINCLNVGWGDATVIDTGNAVFLIDCHKIEDYASHLPSSKNIRGVFITHQHRDHFSGLEYLKDQGYSIDCLIYSPYNRRRGDHSVSIEEWNDFISFRDYFEDQGTKLYSPYRQKKFDGEAWWETNGINFEIIGPHQSVADSDTRELHDASLVIKAVLGDRKCLFAGDASDENLEYIADNTKNFCNDILHASHHGSENGAYLDFIKKCNAEYTLISTTTGVYPNSPIQTALRRYADHTKYDVRRTDQDGTWQWNF
jgi:beta-lactamase superfamily II metal-dependent hydrolase